jgi:hypothetical protein
MRSDQSDPRVETLRCLLELALVISSNMKEQVPCVGASLETLRSGQGASA